MGVMFDDLFRGPFLLTEKTPQQSETDLRLGF
jgi:hypothetical protein